jgi:hypothetical protein
MARFYATLQSMDRGHAGHKIILIKLFMEHKVDLFSYYWTFLLYLLGGHTFGSP